jgi:protein gp37
MSDLFHAAVPVAFIVAVCEVMALASWHTFQVLTKRSERMMQLLNGSLREFAKLPNVWWGVSVENRSHGLPRIDHLRRSAVGFRFLSIEPLLEDLGQVDLRGILWVIVGGESGPGARPMAEEWVASLRDQCAAAATPFFFKQWGGVQKARRGRLLQGRTYEEMPVREPSTVPSRRGRLQARLRGLELEKSFSEVFAASNDAVPSKRVMSR